MKRMLVCLLQILLAVGGAVAAKVPDWIENPQKSYPRESYFVAVRDAKDRDEAELRAVESIASVFGQDISSETEAESVMREKSVSSALGGKTTELEKSLNGKILRSMSQDDLIGIEIAAHYFDKKGGRHYALAVMDKEKAFSVYKKIILANDSKAKSHVQAAKKEFFSLYAYARLLTAYSYAKANEKYAARTELLSPEQGEMLSAPLVKTSDITPMLLDIAQKTKIAVKIEPNAEKEIASAFSEVLSGFGFIVSEEKTRYTLTGTVNFLERTLSDKGVTNAEYSVQCKIKDNESGDEFAPWNISGREGAKSPEYAKTRAMLVIKKRIGMDYKAAFKDSLGGKYE